MTEERDRKMQISDGVKSQKLSPYDQKVEDRFDKEARAKGIDNVGGSHKGG